MIRLILRNSTPTPCATLYGTNSLNVTVVNPALVPLATGSVASSTVNKIGSVTAIPTALPVLNEISIG